MLELNLGHIRSGTPWSVLCLGAHSDDIEVGCGGTILRLLAEHDNIDVFWVVFSADRRRQEEALQSADRFLAHANRKTVVVKNFKGSFFPFHGEKIKRYFERLKGQASPNLIFTHYRHDLHQDHRLISDLTWNTFRNHLILEYEIPKYDGDLSSPNLYVHLDYPTCRNKVQHILECFKTQQAKPWFTEDTLFALMRLRGVEANAPGKYAEGFYCRKMIV